MNSFSVVWKCFIVFSLSLRDCPLQPSYCVHFNGLGYLTAEPAPPFLLGSNLTVFCHITECKPRSKIFLELHSGDTLAPSHRFNCTTAEFHLFNIRVPKSSVLCKLEFDDKSKIVNGLDLRGGYPPDKPTDITCETTRSSDSVVCSWLKGRETHLETYYHISINRLNGTQVVYNLTKGAEEVSIPRAKIDGNTTYQLIITAYNHHEALASDPFFFRVDDIVIPVTPQIMQLEFLNNSVAAILRWKTTESTELLRSCVRLHTANKSWESGEVSEPSQGLLIVEGLKPLTDYEFQVRTCLSSSGLMYTNMACFTSSSASSKKSSCSKWSPSVRGKSPGKGPSQPLHVWRILGHERKNKEQMATVLWKHPDRKDYSGEVLHYKISLGIDQENNVTCAAALSKCSVLLLKEVQTLSVTVVTSYGTSPPADVPLRQSGNHGPIFSELFPAPKGSSVYVSWSCPENKCWSPHKEKLLYYVLEWTSSSVAELQWQRVDKHKNSTTIKGLTAGVRYNISVSAVTSRGVSAPSSQLIYSKELKPQSGPTLSVLAHEARRIHLHWDELPVDQQRGFITNYTMYIQTLDSSSTELRVTVSGSDLRQKWLDCPDGPLALQMTASTSAGEGPRGSRVPSQPAAPAIGLLIVMVFIVTLVSGITANLLCWSCVRERIKQKCISWGPACVGEDLPKPGNSFAIRLLKVDRSEPSFSSLCSDPPLSPVSLISEEESNVVYPNVHIELSEGRPGQPTAETPLLNPDPEVMLVDGQQEHVSYKPQSSALASQVENTRRTEEEHEDTPGSVQEDRKSCLPGGLLGDLLSSVEVDFSSPAVDVALGPGSDLLWPQNKETERDLNGGISLERKEDSKVEMDSVCQDETTVCDPAATCLSQYRADPSQTAGYFPQLAAVNTVTLSYMKR